MREDDNRSASSEQALGQSCGHAVFQNSLPIMLLADGSAGLPLNVGPH
jgi:hypothetical protein